MKTHPLAVLVSAAALVGLVAPAASGQKADAPKLWAVIVSVEDYKAPIPERAGMTGDGQKLARWLTDPEGADWEAGQVLSLNRFGKKAPPDDPRERTPTLLPTRENLDWAVERWLPARAGKGDLVLIAFFGRATIAGGEALLPVDARVPGPNLWTPERGVEGLLRDRKCGAVLTWVDAPFFDAPAPAPAPAEAKGPEPGESLRGRLARWPGASTWMATGDRPIEKPPGSRFASALIAALGRSSRTLLTSLATLDQDPEVRGLNFRRLGQFPPELNLYRASFRAPRNPALGLLVQAGHAGRVNALAIRGDGRAMASAGDDSTIRIWDPSANERALVRVIPELLDGVNCLALSPDGSIVAGADEMGTVRAWDLVDGARPIRLGSADRESSPAARDLRALPDEPPAGSKSPTTTGFVTVRHANLCEIWEVGPLALARTLVSDRLGEGLLLGVATRGGGPSAFAVVNAAGTLRAYKRSGKPAERAEVRLPRDAGRPSAFRLDAEGRRAFVGTEGGRYLVVDLATGLTVSEGGPLAGPIATIRPGPGDLLAVAAGRRLFLVSPGPATPSVEVAGFDDPTAPVDDPAVAVEFSPDGRFLAAASKAGRLAAWRLDPGPKPVRVDLGVAESSEFSCLAFGPASAPPMLVAGEADGGIRRWDLRPVKQRPRLAPHRGKVARAAASRAGRYLLQVTDDGIGQVWDLERGRSVRTLDGAFSAGTFLPDDDLAMARKPDDGGGIVVLDPGTGRPAAGRALERPAAPPGAEVADEDYGQVAASKDGRWLVASASTNRPEMVRVWDLRTGRLRSFVPGHGAVASLDLSADGLRLLTAGPDGSARLWDLSAPDGLRAPAEEFRDEQVASLVVARLGVAGPIRVLAAGESRDGKSLVLGWEARRGAERGSTKASLALEPFAPVLSAEFLRDGRFIAAAGLGRQIYLWEVDDKGKAERRPVLVDPGNATSVGDPHHSEKINALAPWPVDAGPSLVSGSDDATLRFWKIEPARKPDPTRMELLGTLTSAPDDAPDRAKGGSGFFDAPWAAFTPQKLYDASLVGEGLISFSDGRTASPPGQFAGLLFRPLLTDEIRAGAVKPPAIKDFAPAPPLVIEIPEDGPADAAEARIVVTLTDESIDPDDLRLYQNDAPIRRNDPEARGDGGFQKLDRPGRPGEYATTVRLLPGDNAFYAMAGRRNDVDARSPDLTVYRAEPGRAGRLHVISLGVGDYNRNALHYPAADAGQLARFLASNGIGADKEPGLQLVLTEGQVGRAGVEEAFSRVRREVRKRPEDTVVVFLAGHTDVLETSPNQSRYCLLLKDFPFPKDAPAEAVLRGPGLIGPITGIPGPKADRYLLQYVTIYRNLMSLDALRRLVIVDACQAEAVIKDPGVLLVKQLDQVRSLDGESRQGRTAYFLASRRGEPALEASELEHGLLTYVLLKGMGDPALKPPPEGFEGFRPDRGADANGDGQVSTGELRQYVAMNLPPLSDVVVAGGVRSPRPEGLARAPRPDRAFEDARIKGNGPSFPLVRRPGPPPAPAADPR